MFTVPQIKKILLQEKLVNEEDINKYSKEAETKDQPLIHFLIEKKVIQEEILYQLLAQSVGKPFVNLKDKNIRPDILFLIPEPIAKAHEIAAYDKTNDEILKIGATDIDDIQTFEFIEKKTGLKTDVSLTSPSSIQSALRLYHKSLEAEFQSLNLEPKEESDQKLKKLASDLPVIRLVDTILEYAIFEGASDIHIEPQEKEILVRYRIDGILRQVMNLPRTVLSGIIARIKILANLKLDEHRRPQDGRFKIENDNYRIAFRVSIIPIFDGEKIVMRVLDESSQLLHLEDLGFMDADLKKIQKAIKRPHGLILVTGPTGSGKTTTLYSVLNTLNTAEVNIATIEDPIEYKIEHINQSQVNPYIDFTFASGLRALLRQDPNIIMVGEIRDKETAEISINAAMTGHLVLSTLHTNEASGALPRLLDMGILPFLIASTINLVIAQRLVRKICKYCIKSYNLDKKALESLSNQLNVKEFNKLLTVFYQGNGCKKCGETGYKGRLGIYEILEVTEEIKKLIMAKASTSEIKKLAQKEGMTLMLEDGLVKAKNGITTIEEVLRVTRE